MSVQIANSDEVSPSGLPAARAHLGTDTRYDVKNTPNLSNSARRWESEAMEVYRGVVQGNGIVLTEPANLPPGAVVEVRVVQPAPDDGSADMDEEAREAAFERRLLRVGIIGNLQNRDPDPLESEDELAELTPGPLLSELLIEERR